MSQKQYRFVVVEDPTTNRSLLVDTDYKDGSLPKGKHRVVAVNAEPLNSLSPEIMDPLRQIDEICDRLNKAYFPKFLELPPLEQVVEE